ncbi:DNA ligase 1 [Iris pallida]|uniref:DNA ligase 1 n=1 Tax=Iris pallida TaxID=29817 RepID=A0AAX6EQJ4_IRIPA|nr:DNA ligase 1 [Iris pallida]
MSGAPKRLHEEGGHSTPLKRSHEETGIFSGLSGKLIPPAGSDFHRPFESGQEGRLAKIQRIEPRESRDVDKRPSLLHRISSSANNIVDHPVSSDSRTEFRISKDVRDGKRENKEGRTEIREFNSDTRMDPQVGKSENELRVDEKEFRSDRAPQGEHKVDPKFDRDSYSAPSSHLSWSKEHNRGKRYYESTNDGLDSWRVARNGLQNTVEVAKDLSRTEKWDSLEAREAVGENKIDLKGEEKVREKERKRKEDRNRDFGEREKDRNEHRNNMHPGEAGNGRKEPLREDEEAERREREKKDTQKDKEHNDKEKEASKRESPNAIEKENWHDEKVVLDGSVRISEQEMAAPEQKRLKDDNWKISDRDVKDKKRERDGDAGDRHERGKSHDKESDDGFAEGDRESFGNGIQQRRRILRSKGTPQATHREPRFWSRTQDNEGSQGKPEVSTVVYKAGECMQELLKSWKEFEASQESKNEETSQNCPTLEIRIPAEYVTSSNRQVRGAQLWGTDVYTNDSDLFAVLMHTGYCRPMSSPPAAIQELRATVLVLPPQEYYTSTLRNNVRSRAWGAGIGCSFRVERCCIVKKGGGTIDLEPSLTHICFRANSCSCFC